MQYEDNPAARRQQYNKAWLALAGNSAPALASYSLEEIPIILEAWASQAGRESQGISEYYARVERAIGKELTRVERARASAGRPPAIRPRPTKITHRRGRRR